MALKLFAKAAPGRRTEAPRTVPKTVAVPPINRRRETAARCGSRSCIKGGETVFVLCDAAARKGTQLSEFIKNYLSSQKCGCQDLKFKGGVFRSSLVFCLVSTATRCLPLPCGKGMESKVRNYSSLARPTGTRRSYVFTPHPSLSSFEKYKRLARQTEAFPGALCHSRPVPGSLPFAALARRRGRRWVCKP